MTEEYLKLWLQRKVFASFGITRYGIAESNRMLQALTSELNDLTDILESLSTDNESDS